MQPAAALQCQATHIQFIHKQKPSLPPPECPRAAQTRDDTIKLRRRLRIRKVRLLPPYYVKHGARGIMRGRRAYVRMYMYPPCMPGHTAYTHYRSLQQLGDARLLLQGWPGVQTHLTTYQNKTEARRGGHPQQTDVWPTKTRPGPCGRR